MSVLKFSFVLIFSLVLWVVCVEAKFSEAEYYLFDHLERRADVN